VEGASLLRVPDPVPPIYFGGSSAAAAQVAAEHVDTYLTWGEPPDQVAEKLAWVRKLAADRGRTLRFGIRLHVVTRDSAKEAWAAASRLLDDLDPAELTGDESTDGPNDTPTDESTDAPADTPTDESTDAPAEPEPEDDDPDDPSPA
jgi:alkanesulfonate monooxygenase